MLCNRPFRRDNSPFATGGFGCGQCMPCRINKRRVWMHRLMLEASVHGESCFVTLTYDEAHLPVVNGLPSLVKDHVKEFIDGLRSHPTVRGVFRVRYYYVGEYGDQTFRPHYHVCLFGVGRVFESVFKELWRHGLIHVGADAVNDNIAQYVGGYLTKKLTKADDPRLLGRQPEFSRMSLKPGIGALAVPGLVDKFSSGVGREFVEFENGAVRELSYGSKKLPLGRYIYGKLKDGLSVHKEAVSWSEILRKEELRNLPMDTESIKRRVQEVRQRRLNQDARFRVHNPRRTL